MLPFYPSSAKMCPYYTDCVAFEQGSLTLLLQCRRSAAAHSLSSPVLAEHGRDVYCFIKTHISTTYRYQYLMILLLILLSRIWCLAF